jgi:hypothetical protein
MRVVCLLRLSLLTACSDDAFPLPALGIDIGKTSVSGLAAGAYMPSNCMADKLRSGGIPNIPTLTARLNRFASAQYEAWRQVFPHKSVGCRRWPPHFSEALLPRTNSDWSKRRNCPLATLGRFSKPPYIQRALSRLSSSISKASAAWRAALSSILRGGACFVIGGDSSNLAFTNAGDRPLVSLACSVNAASSLPGASERAWLGHGSCNNGRVIGLLVSLEIVRLRAQPLSWMGRRCPDRRTPKQV